MKAVVSMLALTLAASVAAPASAQVQDSFYTRQRLNSIYLENSARNFSADRIRNQVVQRAVPTFAFSNVNRTLFNNVTSAPRPNKPFANVQRGANVTPYIGLLSENPFNSTVTNYYALVRPQMEQQRVNERVLQQSLAIQRRLNDIAAQGPFNPAGSDQMAPTGHSAVYMNFGGYFPPPASAGRRR